MLFNESQKPFHFRGTCTDNSFAPCRPSFRQTQVDGPWRSIVGHRSIIIWTIPRKSRAEDRKRRNRKRRRMRRRCIIPPSRCVRRMESWFSPGHNISNGILFRSNYTPERFASARASLLLCSTDRRTELNRRRRFFISSASNSGSLSPMSFLWTEWFY